MREPAAFFGVATAALPFLANRSLRTRLAWSLLLAFSSPVVFYSTRLKQYTLEAFFVTALIVVFLRAYEEDARSMWIAFFGMASILVMTLHTPIFIVFTAAIVAIANRRTRRAPIVVMFLIVAALFGVAYVTYMAPGP